MHRLDKHKNASQENSRCKLFWYMETLLRGSAIHKLGLHFNDFKKLQYGSVSQNQP